jgi:hypothetical protein
MFVGNPFGFNNPVRQILEEALSVFGHEKQVSLILSLGTGRPAVLSRPLNMDSILNVLTFMVLESEKVSGELSAQLSCVKAYLRLNVDQGMENVKMTDWHESELGSIMTHTDAYLDAPVIKSHINTSSKLLQERTGSISLGQLSMFRASENICTASLLSTDRAGTGAEIATEFVFLPIIPDDRFLTSPSTGFIHGNTVIMWYCPRWGLNK